ncbi:squalene/phytoene synthase family protein [Roseomonas marmotae]|uniref:Squalene/phytoene synthase family protein n=1 Tax=Roseomonas marmotae TaxID=2768161 RepID=A0ABS3KAJ0_9PROT|nr:squalene/phytoene synthase family protein [Roseomonas marmotae]MBO1074468.1 squalene/phytoene synthase family protein [Roseomonas marmotae]QTI78202.1 squalene/phytoene synthase family protein [Roseomonas marmotae]
MPDAAPLSELAAFARRNDPDRFLCALFAPPEARETLFLLTAFNHELARARAATTNTMTGLIRLQWWREVVEQAAANTPPRRHEIALPLAEAIRAGRLQPEELMLLIDAREPEMEEEVPSLEALQAFLRGTAGGYAVIAGRILAAPPAAMPGLQAMGAAYGMASLLRGTASLAAQGRCLLPVDLLGQHGLTPADVVRDPRAPAISKLGRHMAAGALESLRHARASLSGTLPRGAVAAALPGRLASRDLRFILSASWNPAEPPPPRGLGDRLAVIWGGWRGL